MSDKPLSVYQMAKNASAITGVPFLIVYPYLGTIMLSVKAKIALEELREKIKKSL